MIIAHNFLVCKLLNAEKTTNINFYPALRSPFPFEKIFLFRVFIEYQKIFSFNFPCQTDNLVLFYIIKLAILIESKNGYNIVMKF